MSELFEKLEDEVLVDVMTLEDMRVFEVLQGHALSESDKADIRKNVELQVRLIRMKKRELEVLYVLEE